MDEGIRRQTRQRKAFYISLLLYTLGVVICAVLRWMETGEVLSVLIVLASFLYLLVIPVLYGILRLKAYRLAIVLEAFIFCAFTLGTAMRWYTKIWWYDLLMHGLSGLLFSLFGLCAYYLLREDKEKSPRADGFVSTAFSFCFSMMIAGMWEIIEYVLFLITGYDSQNVPTTGVGDTMEDMMICLAGAAVFALLQLIYTKKGKLRLLFSPTEEFCRLIGGNKNRARERAGHSDLIS